MSLDYLKVETASSNSGFPEYIYNKYCNDEKYINYFAKVLEGSKNFINENFEGVKFSIFGRIKAKNSYLKKVALKDNQVFDIYGFKIIVNDVNGDFKSDNPKIIEIQERIKLLESTNVNDCNSDSIKEAYANMKKFIATDISNSLVADGSSFLIECNSANIFERSKDYLKENGYQARHRTIVENDLSCFAEFQCCSVEEYEVNCSNHKDFKEDKYDTKISFPFDALNSLESLEKYVEENLPTYVYVSDGKLIKYPPHAIFIRFYRNILHEVTMGEDSCFKQRIIDRINELAREYVKGKNYSLDKGD